MVENKGLSSKMNDFRYIFPQLQPEDISAAPAASVRGQDLSSGAKRNPTGVCEPQPGTIRKSFACLREVAPLIILDFRSSFIEGTQGSKTIIYSRYTIPRILKFFYRELIP